MFCTKCGSKAPDGAVFCTQCGVAINKEQPANPTTELTQTREGSRPGFALAATIMGYVVAALLLLLKLEAGIVLGVPIVLMSVYFHLGKHWARITLTVLFAAVILGVLSNDSDHLSEDACALLALSLIISICGIVFSWLPSVNKWIRYVRMR